jgi:hypothetical protein
MFNFISASIQAYNQIGFFIGALFCLGLGGAILGNALYWRVHALRVTGTIIGVIARDSTYAPVYRYTSPDGQICEAKSDTGSGWARHKETGRTVPLMISAHNPTQAREVNNYLFDVIGILLIVPGVWLGYTALTAYPITWTTWVMAAAMLFYLFERGRRVLIPKGQRLSIAEWRKQHGLGDTTAIDPVDIKPIETIVATPEVQQKLQTQRLDNKKAAPIVGFFAIALLGVGIYQAKDMARLESSGLRAQGEVVRMVGESSSSSGGGYTYHAIVRFRTDKNVRVEFKDAFGSNPPTHRPSDMVTVLYLADDPREHAIIDRGLFWNWAIPGILFLAGALLALMLVYMLRSGATGKLNNGLADEPQA